MTTEEIIEILNTRVAVYKLGVSNRLWNDLDASGAKELTGYLFPKSGHVAYYNLLLEFMRKEHKDIQGEVYHLYKLPVQHEKEIIDYLKKNNVDITKLIDSADAYLHERDTVLSDISLIPTSIGSLRHESIDTILRLFAKQYLYSIERKLTAYPYCD